jgi:hypothetical protein
MKSKKLFACVINSQAGSLRYGTVRAKNNHGEQGHMNQASVLSVVD